MHYQSHALLSYSYLHLNKVLDLVDLCQSEIYTKVPHQEVPVICISPTHFTTTCYLYYLSTWVVQHNSFLTSSCTYLIREGAIEHEVDCCVDGVEQIKDVAQSAHDGIGWSPWFGRNVHGTVFGEWIICITLLSMSTGSHWHCSYNRYYIISSSW